MITLAFAQMAFFALVSIEEYGGDDGLVIDTRSEFGGLIDLEQTATLYYLILAALIVSLYLVRRIVASRFGRVIRGAKSNDERAQAIGLDSYRYRLACYVISGALCGLAGALLGNFTGFISPDMMDWTRSGELIFMVVARRRGLPHSRGISVVPDHPLADHLRASADPHGALRPRRHRRAARRRRGGSPWLNP